MVKKKMKGFTLIELIAVLVIMAIIALIVTPLVMSIIKKAKTSADKRSIDAYGRSIELAIAGYLLDNGSFPTSIEQLTIEYSGDEVVCATTQLNKDSSVYLEKCRVGGRSVDYEYGEDKLPSYNTYSVGDEINYNGINYYVIKNSGVKEENVTLLKQTPLLDSELLNYGEGHINRYASYGSGYGSINTYGHMAYYTSETCGCVNYSYIESGCTVDYNKSDIKYVVDAWKIDQAPLAIEARLITYEELIDNLGFDPEISSSGELVKNENVPDWVCSNDYMYWTMTPYDSNIIWGVTYNRLSYIYGTSFNVYNKDRAVRPVIVLPKSAISS